MVRLKNRYFVVKISSETSSNKLKFNDGLISKCVLRNVEKFYGVFGLASVENGFKVKYCNDQTRITIIRCRHGAHRFVSSILPLITVIGEIRAKFQTLYTGATIMKCNKFIVNYQRNYLNKISSKIQSAKERIDFVKNVMDFAID